MENRVKRFIDEYGLMSADDKIFVAVSGGKDSTVLLHILNKFFKVEAITIDAGVPKYSRINLDNIRKFCSERDVPLHVFSLKNLMGESLASICKRTGQNYCTACGIIKRYYLNLKAKELGATVIATGHNMDDTAQSFLMNLFRNQVELNARIGPVSGARKQKGFVRKVKPLFLVSEAEIKEYSKGFPIHYGKCPYSRTAYRNTLRDILWDYEEKHPGTIKRIVKGYLKMLPKFQEHYKGKVGVCEVCGEPSNSSVCARCKLALS